MSRRAVGTAAFAVVLLGVAIFAWKGPRGLVGWFGGSSGSDAERAPGELGLDGSTNGRDGAAGTGPGKELDGDRVGVLASRHVERRGVGGLRLKIVRAGTRVAVEGAAVSVVGTGHGGEDVRANALSDATGTAIFTQLAAGQGYVVRVSTPTAPAIDRPDVEVRAGRDGNLGAFEIGAVGTLVGCVLDETGKPVAGADVRVLASPAGLAELLGNLAELFGTLGREPTPLAKGTSSSDGRFRLDDLPPGPVLLVANANGLRQATLRLEMRSTGPVSGEPTLVLEAGGVIAGVVVDATGRPVAGARLALIDMEGGDPSSLLLQRTFSASGADGRFRVVVGEASKEVHAIVEAQGFPATYSDTLTVGQEDVRIVLLGGATVEVRVEEDGGHAPIEGAQVALNVARGDQEAPSDVGGFLYGSTDATGVVTFVSGPGHISMMMVNHRDFAGEMRGPPDEVGAGVPTGASVASGDVKVGIVTRVVIRMTRGLVIRGRVLDPSGRPIPGADVRTVGTRMFGGGSTSRSAADGTYRVVGGAVRVPGIEVGGEVLHVSAPGWTQPRASMEIPPSETKDGEVRHDVTLIAGAVVRGQVLDADGSPLAGASVRIDGVGDFDETDVGGGAPSFVTTAADGTYELRDVAPSEVADEPETPEAGSDGASLRESPKPSTRVLAAAEERLSATSEPFVVTAGATVTVPPLKLTAGATLRGSVREPSGRPAAFVRVEVGMGKHAEARLWMPLDDVNRPRTIRTDGAGGFVVRGLPAAEGHVIARARGFAPAGAAFEVTDGDPAPLELRLLASGELRGLVTGAGGVPIAGATVGVETTAHDPDAVYVEATSESTDADGRFALKGLPRTALSLSVRARGYRPRTVTGLPGGDAMDVELVVRGPADERRRQEIAKELFALRTKRATASEGEERRSLDARESALRQELAELGDDSDESGVTVTGTEDTTSPAPIAPPVPDVGPPLGK